MFRLLLVLLSFLIIFCVLANAENPNYTTKFDNIDLEEVVKNERLLKNYVDCLLEKGRCTPDGLELRQNLPDAIQTDCSKCSEKQKQGSDFMMHYLIDNKPEFWHDLELKYDPEQTYKKKYLESRQNEVTATAL